MGSSRVVSPSSRPLPSGVSAAVSGTWGARAAASVVRRRWPVLCGLAVVVGVMTRASMPDDSQSFARFGQLLLTGHWSAVYATAWNESGPLQLVFCSLLRAACATTVTSILVHAAGNLGLLALLRHALRRLRADARIPASPVAELGVGLAVVLWIMPDRLWQAHPAQLVIPLLWVAAGLAARRGNGCAAAVALGVAGGWETWSVLALPMLLLLGQRRTVLRAAVLALTVSVAWYVPFALTGHFQLFGHVWKILPDTPLHSLFPTITNVTWWLRLLQGAATTTVCAVVVSIMRRTPHVVTVAPLAAMLIRFVFDPYVLDYYWLSVSLLAVITWCVTDRRSRPVELVALAALAYLPYLTDLSVREHVVASLAALALAVISSAAQGRRDHLPARSASTPADSTYHRPARPSWHSAVAGALPRTTPRE